MRLAPALLLLGACAPLPEAAPVAAPPPEPVPGAGVLAEDGYRATPRSDGAVVFDIRHTAPDVTRLWIEDVAPCWASDYALANGHGAATLIGQRGIQVEAGEGFPKPLMQGAFIYRFLPAASGAAGAFDAAATLARCKAEGLV